MSTYDTITKLPWWSQKSTYIAGLVRQAREYSINALLTVVTTAKFMPAAFQTLGAPKNEI